MASKWLPPLLCPIPKGHANHAHTVSAMLSSILRRRTLAAYNIFDPLDKEKQEQWADLSDRQSTFNRIFARRKNKYMYRIRQNGSKIRIPSKRTMHKIKFRYGLEDVRYFLIDGLGTVIKIYRTKREGLADIAKNSVKVKKSGSWKTVDLVPGMRLVGLPKYAIDVFDIIRSKMIKTFPTVQVKRCNDCPNTKSNRGTCHCQFWASIRGDNVDKINWMSPHEYKMKEHRDKKTPPKTIKIGFDELFN